MVRLTRCETPLRGAHPRYVAPYGRNAAGEWEGADKQQPRAAVGAIGELRLLRTPSPGDAAPELGEGAVFRQARDVPEPEPKQVVALPPQQPRGARIAVSDTPIGAQADEAVSHAFQDLSCASPRWRQFLRAIDITDGHGAHGHGTRRLVVSPQPHNEAVASSIGRNPNPKEKLGVRPTSRAARPPASARRTSARGRGCVKTRLGENPAQVPTPRG